MLLSQAGGAQHPQIFWDHLHVRTHEKQETQLSLPNLHDAFIGQSRSPNIVPFHKLNSYCAIATLSLRHAIFTIFDFKNVVTLKSGSEVTQGH